MLDLNDCSKLNWRGKRMANDCRQCMRRVAKSTMRQSLIERYLAQRDILELILNVKRALTDKANNLPTFV